MKRKGEEKKERKSKKDCLGEGERGEEREKDVIWRTRKGKEEKEKKRRRGYLRREEGIEERRERLLVWWSEKCKPSKGVVSFFIYRYVLHAKLIKKFYQVT